MDYDFVLLHMVVNGNCFINGNIIVNYSDIYGTYISG